MAYQPLTSRMVGGVHAGTVELRENSFGTEHRVIAPKPGEIISMWVGLGNDGPYGVTIVEVANRFNPDGVVDPRTSSDLARVGTDVPVHWRHRLGRARRWAVVR